MLSLIWWVIVIAAAVQAGRAWGIPGGLGALVGLIIASWFPLGWLLSVGAAVFIGYRAENQLQPMLTTRG